MEKTGVTEKKTLRIWVEEGGIQLCLEVSWKIWRSIEVTGMEARKMRRRRHKRSPFTLPFSFGPDPLNDKDAY